MRNDLIENGTPAPVLADDNCIIGKYWATPHGWFCDPNRSQIQTIPCVSREDAIATIRKHGSHPTYCPNPRICPECDAGDPTNVITTCDCADN